MNTAYLLIGGNLGNVKESLEKACSLINDQCGHVSKLSSFYKTAAWGNTQQPDFLNVAIEIKTQLNAKQLIRRILKIEKQMGRIRKEKYGPRIIDIDILLYNEEEYEMPFLKVPHPELHNRRFALAPLAEIAPTVLHPGFKKNINELLRICPDESAVEKITQ
jgi:2-amino-4-hydroxy-6-hydroxymethyldihydropteridine diphosphokinase